MQLHNDVKRELRMDFTHFEEHDAVVTGCARFPGHLHMRHPITDIKLQKDTYT